MIEQFPVRLICCGDGNISKIYVEERGKVSDPETLKAHVERWKVLWEWGEGTEEEQQLASGNYDPEKVYECFRKHSRTTHCGCTTPSCHAMHIVLPLIFVPSFNLSQKYGVCFDIAFFRVLEVKGAITDDDRANFY